MNRAEPTLLEDFEALVERCKAGLDYTAGYSELAFRAFRERETTDPSLVMDIHVCALRHLRERIIVDERRIEQLLEFEEAIRGRAKEQADKRKPQADS